MIIYVCDKCKARSDKQGNGRCKPSGWRELTFNTGFGRPKLDYILCPKCQGELKLPKNEKMMDFGEQLLEIISAIAEGVVQP